MSLRRRRLLRLGLAGFVGIPCLLGCGGSGDGGAAQRGRALDPGEPVAASTVTNERSSEASSSEAPSTAKTEGVDLWIGGDLHLGEGGPEVVESLRALVPAGSLGVLNLEGPIGARASQASVSVPGEAPILSNGEAVPTILRGLGVGVVGVANNHADDLGVAGRRRTIEALRAEELGPVGGDAGPLILERQGLRLGFSAHYLRPGEAVELQEELGRVRTGVDHLIATFHVDGPPSYLPSAELRAAVEQAVDAGASVVAAHGSHTLARVDRHGQAVVAWGLGNLAFACRCTDEVDGGILRVRLGSDEVAVAEWIPIAAGLYGEPLAPHPEAPLLFELMGSLRSAPGRVIDGRYRLDLGAREEP